MRRKSQGTEWMRKCPKCTQTMFYASKGNLNKATAAERVCMHCKNEYTPEYRQRLSDSLKGRKTGNRQYRASGDIPRPFKRACPECQREMGYARHDLLLRAMQTSTVCNSCSNKLYRKSWRYVIKDEHVKQMAATKAGYGSYDAYMADLDAKTKYRREVWRITRRQDISRLENAQQMRTLCGVDGGYQLDHVTSIDAAYKQGISPEQVGSLGNLRITSERETDDFEW